MATNRRRRPKRRRESDLEALDGGELWFAAYCEDDIHTEHLRRQYSREELLAELEKRRLGQ